MRIHVLIRTVLMAGLIGIATSVAGPDKKPNIILIMADDLGYGDIGCYGNADIATPHIDALAKTGVLCTDFHSNGAVCSPTRAALFTGRYQQRSGIHGVITARNHRDQGLALEELTFAEHLKQHGYRTALFGKWHVGYPARYNPVFQGFDEFRGFVSGNIDYHRHIDQVGYADWWHQDVLKPEVGYLTDLITEKAVNFIRRNQSDPFCLVVTHGAPHYPIQGRDTPGFREEGKATIRASGGDKPRVRREMIEIMDEGIGKMVSVLDSLKLRSRTLIVFCSDNGPDSLGSAGVLRGRKGSPFEGGHRVAGIFNWPGHLPAGTQCHATLLTMDLFPTLAACAGGVTPMDLDGMNVFAALKGENLRPRAVFWGIGKSVAVREGKWKLIYHRGNQTSVLYDLENDLGETADVSSHHPDIAQHLLRLVMQWQKDMERYESRS